MIASFGFAAPPPHPARLSAAVLTIAARSRRIGSSDVFSDFRTSSASTMSTKPSIPPPPPLPVPVVLVVTGAGSVPDTSSVDLTVVEPFTLAILK